MSVSELVIRAAPDLSEISVRRGDGVPDLFWERATAEWGVSGARSKSLLIVPIERFLSQLGWVKPACLAHRVELDFDDVTRGLITRGNRERRVLEELRAGGHPPANVDDRLQGSRFKRDLREFQRRDLAQLLALPNGANFSVPGAGKTAVTYALYEAEHLAGRVERLLVVAPLSAFEAWNEELTECFSQPPRLHVFDGQAIPTTAEICVVNYQRLSGNYRALADWVSDRPTHVVLDEAHRVKRGWGGEWGRAALSLAFLAARRDILTGTPAPQGLRDLDALFDFAWPGLARAILPGQLFARAPTLSPKALADAVGGAIAPLFVRTTKHDLKLPKVTFAVTTVPLEGLQRQIYQALRSEYAGELSLTRRERLDFARMGHVVMYLLEAASNPQLLSAGSSDFDLPDFRHPPLELDGHPDLRTLLRDYPLYETPRKFVELAKLIHANAQLKRKTLIWTSFVRNIATLERLLRAYQPAIVHGGVPPKSSAPPSATRTRDDELHRFRTDDACMVLIANPAAMSEGVSLHQDCHDAIYLDRTFNAGQYLQSVDRIHRLGLEDWEDTRITFLITADTIDEVVNRRVAEKAVRMGHILDDPGVEELALPDEEDYGGPLENDQDLAALFAHLRGDGAPGGG